MRIAPKPRSAIMISSSYRCAQKWEKLTTLDLLWNSLFVFSGALQEQFINNKDTISTEMPGHNSLSFIAQQVRHNSNVENLHALSGGVGNGSVQDSSQATLSFDLLVIARNMSDCA